MSSVFYKEKGIAMLKKFKLEKSRELGFQKLCIRVIFIVVGICLFIGLAFPVGVPKKRILIAEPSNQLRPESFLFTTLD